MDIAGYIESMPKAELNISLEGAVRAEAWLMVAEQNEIMVEARKPYIATRDLLEKRDTNRLDELVQGVCGWLRYPDDLARIVYDAGLTLSKQNVKYAEISVNPSLFMPGNMTFDTFMTALNDGRDRAQRGWGIIIRWNLVVSREEPRRADEVMRMASSAAGKKHHIVGYGLTGREDAQPIGQFERAFQTAEKKNVPTFTRSGEIAGAEAIDEVLAHLAPDRIVDAVGLLDSPAAIAAIIEQDIAVIATPSRAKALKKLNESGSYPLRALLDRHLALTLSADLPEIFGQNTTDVYLQAARDADLTMDEIDQLVLNGLQYSFLDEPTKAELSAMFLNEISQLRKAMEQGESPAES
ncbi:MAG: hypothetical protein EA396_06150 [Anaerolineaceae bacterium]|nr:MAG: hypothetical protein EA396_06150 [Anaerolineaceae bacterium]